MEKEKAKTKGEIEQMSGYLQSKIEKNLQLEMHLDEIKDAYRALEKSMTQEDRSYKNRVQLLEKNLEQLTTMYQNTINEKQIMKANIMLYESKNQKSTQRSHRLEKKYEQERKKNQHLEQILLILRKDVENSKKRGDEEKNMGVVRNSYAGAGSRVAIRGGGGKRMATPRTNSGQIDPKNAPSVLRGSATR